MAKLFDFTIKNGAAGGFGMFSAAHFTWLAALVAAGSGVCLAYKNADENSRRGNITSAACRCICARWRCTSARSTHGAAAR